MNKLRLVFDGLCGVGKTYLVKKLFNEYKDKKISFYEGPIEITNEIKATKEDIKAFKNNYNIIENSFFQSLLVKQFLCNYGYINSKDYLKSEKLYLKNINLSKTYLHILLISSKEQIEINRINRGREYEYIKGFRHQEELDQYILSNLIKLYIKHQVNYLIINVNKVEDLKKLKNIIKKLL